MNEIDYHDFKLIFSKFSVELRLANHLQFSGKASQLAMWFPVERRVALKLKRLLGVF